MSARLTQLLGVVALEAADRLRIALAGETGLSATEAGALVHLQAWPGASIRGLAGVAGLSQPATVRLADRLSDQGLLARRPGPDRRTVSLELTVAGRRAADAALAARAAALAPLVDDLRDEDRRTLTRLLERVAEGLAHDHPGALHVCRLCDRESCTSGPGCPLEHTADPDRARPRA